MRRLQTWLISLLVSALLAGSARADVCRDLYASLSNHSYANLQGRLAASLAQLPPEEAKRIQSIVDSLYFVDYKHSAPELLDVFQGRTLLKDAKLDAKYETERAGPGFFARLFGRKPAAAAPVRPVFQNFLDSLASLKSTRERDLAVADIFEAHLQAMKGEVEKLPKNYLGTVRDMDVIGNVFKGISEQELAEITRNPYLGFEIASEAKGNFGKTYTGKILYPTPANIRPEALERLVRGYPELVAEVKALKEAKGAASPDLKKRVIAALLDERLTNFVAKRGELGAIDSPEKLQEYVSLVTDFQRDFIAIHPFRNGNGRTSRALLYELLARENIPPPRFLSVDEDIQASAEVWRDRALKGIVATQRLYDDLAYRASAGLPLETSPELLTPVIPRSVAIGFKKQGTQIVVENSREAALDSSQFASWLKLRFQKEPALLTAFRQDPVRESEKLTEEFKEFAKKNKLDFEHKKQGLAEISLNFVDDDFRTLFGNASYREPRAWKDKVERWHQAEQTVWRGLSYRDREVPETEIVDMFRKLHPQMVSEKVKRAGTSTPEALLAEIKKDFDRYNKDLYNEELWKMAKDHAETGPMYSSSYGFSTSRRREVGKAFAMGAMVVGKYGEHQEMQHLLKSRILIGAMRSKKDVELAKLYHIDSRFTYAYPRQAEVMGIGAADPDSIMVIQKIAADGSVELTYARDPARPNKLWVVRGEFEPKPGVTPNPAQIVKEITLE